MVSSNSSAHATALTALKGIGPAKQQRLKQALDIQTIEELLNYDAEEIEARLAATGAAISQHEIRQWLSQAQNLVPSRDGRKAEAAMPEVANPEGDTPEFSLDSKSSLDNSGPETNGASVISANGTFAVRLDASGAETTPRLHVEHVETGQTNIVSQENAADLYAWVEAQISSPSAQAQTSSSTFESVAAHGRSTADAAVEEDAIAEDVAVLETTPAGSNIPHIDIMDLGMVVLDSNGLTVQSTANQLPQYLPKDCPFSMTVRFRIIRNGEAPQATDLVAVAQFFVRNRVTGAQMTLGVSQAKVAELAREQHLQSPPTRLSEAGLYQLQAMVTLQNVRAAASYREMQLVQVI